MAKDSVGLVFCSTVDTMYFGLGFGKLQTFFYGGMIFGTILGPWIYDLYRYEVFRVTWLADFNVRGLGLPFFISGILGLVALILLLIFVKEPPRQT